MPAAPALAVATVKSATGATSHLVGLARFTPAGALDATFGTAGTRTQDISPSHVFDAAALASLPGGGFVVGGGMGIGANTQFGPRRLSRRRQPRHDAQPANATAHNAANLQVGTGGVDSIFALALTPQGRPARRGRAPGLRARPTSARSSGSGATRTLRRRTSR
jgi:hypothetical protein